MGADIVALAGAQVIVIARAVVGYRVAPVLIAPIDDRVAPVCVGGVAPVEGARAIREEKQISREASAVHGDVVTERSAYQVPGGRDDGQGDYHIRLIIAVRKPIRIAGVIDAAGGRLIEPIARAQQDVSETGGAGTAPGYVVPRRRVQAREAARRIDIQRVEDTLGHPGEARPRNGIYGRKRSADPRRVDASITRLQHYHEPL